MQTKLNIWLRQFRGIHVEEIMQYHIAKKYQKIESMKII